MEQSATHPLARSINQPAINKTMGSLLQSFTKACLAGAFLALSAGVAILITLQTGMPVIGALLFPAGFAMLLVFGWELIKLPQTFIT